MAACNNGDHAPRSLYDCLFAPQTTYRKITISENQRFLVVGFLPMLVSFAVSKSHFLLKCHQQKCAGFLLDFTYIRGHWRNVLQTVDWGCPTFSTKVYFSNRPLAHICQSSVIIAKPHTLSSCSDHVVLSHNHPTSHILLPNTIN